MKKENQFMKILVVGLFIIIITFSSTTIIAPDIDPGSGGGGGWTSWESDSPTGTVYYYNPSGGCIRIGAMFLAGWINYENDQVIISRVCFESSSTWDPLLSYSAQVQVYFNPGAVLKADRTTSISDPPAYPSFGYFEVSLLTSLYADFGQDVYFRVYIWVSNYDRSISECCRAWAIVIP